MNTHPLFEELVSAAQEPTLPAELAAHVERCEACRTKLARLRGGVALLAEARSAPAPVVAWGDLDAVIDAEARRVSSELRAGRLRAPRRWGTVVTLGVALAAAASALVALREPAPPPSQAQQATTEPRPRGPGVPEGVVAPEPRAAFEGEVLLLAGAVLTHTPTDGVARPVVASAALREGGRLETTATGRVVVTVQPGWKLDLRPGTDVTLSKLREGEVGIALAKGEASLVGDASESARVTVRARAWEIAAKGEVITRVEDGFIRVTVLSGKATVRRGEYAQDVLAPAVVALPDGEGSFRRVEERAADAQPLDLAVLSRGARLWELPPLGPEYQLTAPGHGALPGGLSALRTGALSTLHARLGRSPVLLVLDLRDDRPLAWRREALTASASTATARASAGNGAANARTATSGPSAHRAPTGQVLMGPGGEGDALTPQQLHALASSLSRRMSHCFDICVERNMCRGDIDGRLVVTVAPDGRISGLRVDATNAEGARPCLERESGLFRGVETRAPYDIQIPVHRSASR